MSCSVLPCHNTVLFFSFHFFFLLCPFADHIAEIISKKLVTPGQTRWNSTYDSIQCLSEIAAEDLDKIADRLGLPRFTKEDHRMMKELVQVSCL